MNMELEKNLQNNLNKFFKEVNKHAEEFDDILNLLEYISKRMIKDGFKCYQQFSFSLKNTMIVFQKIEDMEFFKETLKKYNFSKDFIEKVLEYFNQLYNEIEVQELGSIEEVIDYYNKCGSFTCNALQSEINLKELREDIALLKDEYPELLDLNLYFTNIEHFEISILYLLFYEFYPQEESDEEEL